MAREKFEVLKWEQKESGKSIKIFHADRDICFTNYYYWKKKFDQPKPETGLVPIEIHNDRVPDSADLNFHQIEISGVSLAFPMD